MDSKKTNVFAVRIPLNIWDKLVSISEKEDRTVSNTIKKALSDFTKKK